MDKAFENSTHEELVNIIKYLSEQLNVANGDRQIVKEHLEEVIKTSRRLCGELNSFKRWKAEHDKSEKKKLKKY